ncbi:Oxidoreductase, short-chain dehydrogenase/reductase family [Olavius algarvensis associated proteobacterium Delta 3]|nr:Oxidoreductase, short-chain dehydrogenase/reductase family [Olavius algarvensis associated proteobacterium Delta 3]CAB5161391.1 Oxidoreductase, short-chain dehydrogenase/reductase family [Olavius algarvensis associated proteobacterium Delta 3]
MDDASRVYLVTGGSRGIGADIARWLGKTGATVCLLARSSRALSAIAADVERLGGRCHTLAADVSNPDACARAVHETMDRFGRIDGLVNNAGILEPLASAADTDPDAWAYNIAVNLNGPFYLCRAAIAYLVPNNGRIVNVSSGAAVHAMAAWSAYCTAKAGLTHFTRVLAAEEPALTVVAVRPGVVDTAMQALIRSRAPGVMTSEKTAYFLELKAEGRLEPPAIPARSIAWLALHAPREWSGEFLDYDDPRVMKAAVQRFGDHLE